MNTHAYFEERAPLYAAGQLTGAERLEMEKHLAGCKTCRAELQFWQSVANEVEGSSRAVTAPSGLAQRALLQTSRARALPAALQRTWQLLRAQTRLVQIEMWPVSAIVLAMGLVVALMSTNANIFFYISPLVTASTLALLYGPQHDPALELSLSTPTSPWKVLLARISLVFIYNLLLSLVGGALLLLIVPPAALGALIFGWLGPLAFLSTLALLLSIWLGTSNAIVISYSLWLLQYMPFKVMDIWMKTPAWQAFLNVYQQFWHNPLLLLSLSVCLLAAALWSANRSTPALARLSV